MSFLIIDTNQLYYEVVGDGRWIVLIHDGLLHSDAWEAQVHAFATHYRVARYDRRGYGRSTAPTTPYSNRHDLRAIIHHLAASSVILIGASMGGGIALDFTLNYPELVSHLVLVGPALPGFRLSEQFVQRNRAAFRPLLEQHDVAATIANWVDDPYLIAPHNRAARDQVRELLTAYPHNLTNPFPLLQSTPPIRPEQLATLSQPTLIVVGEADIADNHAAAGAIHFAMPNAQRIIIPNSGHLPYLENAAAFNETVLPFLQSA